MIGEKVLDYNHLTEFILTVRKSYRDNPYHNFEHAFTVFHCMFNILHRNIQYFTNLEVSFSDMLLFNSFCNLFLLQLQQISKIFNSSEAVIVFY